MSEPTRGDDGILYGYTEPRVFTPPLRPLWPRSPETEQWTDGYKVIDFAEHVLDLPLLPWQQWLAVHALELLPSGKRRFRTIVAEVARQNGKSHFSSVLSLWLLYMHPGHKVLGTSATLSTAEKQWGECLELAQSVPDLADELDPHNKSNTNGNKYFGLTNRSQYLVRATNRKATRGYSIDMVLLDELREADSEGWGAATKTTLARPGAQTWCLSNAGDDKSTILKRLRKVAHEALGDPDGIVAAEAGGLEVDAEVEVPDDESMGWYEWSADPKTPPSDRDSWAHANPGLGYTIEEAAIAAARVTDEPHVFDTECRCVWVEVAGVSQFPDGTWEAGIKEDSRRSPDSRLAWAVDMSHDRTMTHVAVAGYREDGKVHIEVVTTRAGVDWLQGWFASRAGSKYPTMDVALQGKGAPISGQAEILEDIPGVSVVPWQGFELGQGAGAFYDAVCRYEVTHVPDPRIDKAAGQAVIKTLGETWIWDRNRSPVDVAPLMAVNAAYWLLTKKQAAPVRSAYEDHGLVVA